MKQIDLKFGGKLYMEWYGEQEEKERIKIFDSEKNYLDYFSVEALEDTAEMNHESVQDALDRIADRVSQKDTIEEVLQYLCVDYYAVYTNKKAIAKAMHISSSAVALNEYVNRIGKYYVEICV